MRCRPQIDCVISSAPNHQFNLAKVNDSALSASKLDYLKNYLKGCAIGAADLVPGVSGGTIALLLGIYPRFIKALSQLSPSTLIDFFKLEKSAWWRQYDLSFLLCLFAGIVTALFALAQLFDYLLSFHESKLYAFFTGLLLASCWQLLRSYAQARVLWWFNLLVFAGFMLWFNTLPALRPEPGMILFFVSGMLSVAVMLLPGISGSLMLVIIGSYDLLVRAVAEFDLLLLTPYALGAGLGFLLFSRLYNWGFERYQRQAMAIFCGLILGAMPKVWPWRDLEGLYLPERVGSYGAEAWLILGGILVVVLPLRVGLIAQHK